MSRPRLATLAALVLGGTLAAAAPRTAAAAPTIASTLAPQCVGGPIGCEQIDFFLTLSPSSASTFLEFLTITLTTPSFVFANPNMSEGDDFYGPAFVDPVVTGGGTVFTAYFPDPFLAFVSPTLRVRVQFDTYQPDLTALTYTYAGGDATNAEIVSGAYPTSAVPEPATIVLLGAGLAGVGVVARRRQS